MLELQRLDLVYAKLIINIENHDNGNIRSTYKTTIEAGANFIFTTTLPLCDESENGDIACQTAGDVASDCIEKQT